MSTQVWPELPLEAWQDTYATLHMWTQVVGKIRMAQTPLINHWWNVPLYVTARGLTTSPDVALLDFMPSTYEAGANLAQWDRAAFERVAK